MYKSVRILPLAVALLAAVPVSQAEARIRCVDGFQIVNGNPISTPYCLDSLLAQVARTYGTKVSAAEIRNNPSLKRRLCHFIGHDTRLRETCVGTGFDAGGGRIR